MMRAVIFDRHRKPKLVNTASPKLHSGYDVIVKVDAVGICGSDLSRISDSAISISNIILGHEVAGTVITTGKEAKLFKKGQRVVLNPVIGCGKCSLCKQGFPQLCKDIKIIGRDVNGGFAEYFSTKQSTLFPIDKNVNSALATLTDPLACAIHAINMAGVPVGKKVAVIGDGPFGLLACLVLTSKKNRVTLFAKHKHVMCTAKKFGIENIIPQSTDTSLELESAYDVVFETVGRNQELTLNQAICLCKPRGIIISGGVYPTGYYGKVGLRKLFYKESILVGVNSHGLWEGKSEFEQATKLLKRFFPIAREIIKVVGGLDNFQVGLDYLTDRGKSKVIKVVFTL